MNVNYILSQKESLMIEYKRQWYWHDDINSDGKNKGVNELYKDFVALFNTGIGTNEIKYFIIGFDEKTEMYQDYSIYIDSDGVSHDVKELKNIETIKDYLIKCFNKVFKKHPDKISDLPALENFIDVDIHMKDEKQIMIISISDAPYLLVLDQDLHVGKCPENSILYRVDLPSGPRIKTMPPEQVDKVVSELRHDDLSKYIKKETSIGKIVNAFKSETYPKASILVSEIKQESTKKYKFELYVINVKYHKIAILFLPKSANQQGTISYLLENNGFYDVTEVIVLMENFHESQPKRVPLLFGSNHKYKIEVYSLQDFIRTEVYSELIDAADLFYNGKKQATNFVIPFSSEGKTVDKLIENWYFSTSKPILVVKGPGGIGKTTVVRYFLETSKLIANVKKLFISSHDVSKEVNKQESKIETLFDFYKIMHKEDELLNKIDKDIFEIAIDSGDVLIVIDGLDEIITKNGDKFDVSDFISSINSNYCNNIAKAKIIITCRDYFWNRFDNINETSISLKSFTDDMAEEFFEKSFPNPTISKIEKALAITKSFGSSEGYFPYILDMVREIFLEKIENNEVIDTNQKLDSKILFSEIDVDRIIGKSCEREIFKLENTSIDKQLDLFIKLAVNYNGSINSFSHGNDILRLSNLQNQNHLFEKFKGHPLLLTSQDQIMFRYDFVNDYFRGVAIAQFLHGSKSLIEISSEIFEVMKSVIRYKSPTTKEIIKRLVSLIGNEGKVMEHLIFKLIEFNDIEINKMPNFINFDANEFNSLIFTLLLSFPSCNTELSRTELMCNIYEHSNEIRKLSIIDLNQTGGSKVTFNFSGKKFTHCHFSGYNDLVRCKFDEVTYFSDSIFKCITAPINTSNTSMKKSNFSDNCQLGALNVILEAINQQAITGEDSLRSDVLSVIKEFWRNGEFKPIKKALLNKNHKNLLVGKLLKHGIIKEIKITTQEKRKDDFYIVDNKYLNLRKVMEENNTCLELNQIIGLIK